VLQTCGYYYGIFILEVLLQEWPTKVSSGIFVPSTGIFISNRILRKWCCAASTAANLTGTISAAALGNSTFYWYYSGCFKWNQPNKL
jgi:hypothetical protein